MYNKQAFTLAEVLITLGIIGIVASMTIPVLMQKNQEQVTVAKVKKFYSIMNQALLFAIKDYGYVNEWTFIDPEEEEGKKPKSSDRFVNYIKPYLKISKDCGGKSGCIAPLSYKQLNNNLWGNYDSNQWYYKMILIDGSYLWIRTNSTECNTSDAGTKNVCGIIWTDINGKQAPNTIGKDVFVFFIQKDRIIPHTNDDCKIGGFGWGCAGYILQYGNMGYLHK